MPTSSSSLPTASKHRRSPLSRSQLEHHLRILKSAVSAPPLPATLPSPPASRSPSPTPAPQPSTTKRKSPHDSPPAEAVKRKRFTESSFTPPEDPPMASTSAAALPPKPAPATLVPAVLPASEQSFRPRRGRPTFEDFRRMKDRHQLSGRALKYSSEHRRSRTGSHSDAISPEMMSRFEAVDALLNFTYSQWADDMAVNQCLQKNWDTMDLFLKWVRSRWENGETCGEPLLAIAGLISMVEAYIYNRKAAFMNISNTKRMGVIHEKARQAPPPETANSSPATSLGGSSQHSIPNGSPNSEPITQPSGSSSRPPSTLPSQPMSSSLMLPVHPTMPSPASRSGSRSPLGPSVQVPTDLFDAQIAAANCMRRASNYIGLAQRHLNLGVLSRRFPSTFRRIISSTLRPDEEYEPDFDQDECSRDKKDWIEGELAWPGPLASHDGCGVAWVCLLGRAMIREIGYPMGYRGLSGALKRDAPPPLAR